MAFLPRLNKPLLYRTLFPAFWVLMLLLGFGGMLVYSNAPGQTLPAQPTWPTQSHLVPARNQPTLVMVIHPQCPCTRATMTELNIMMSQLHGKLKVYTLFYKPSGYDVSWEKTVLWKKAKAIPGVTLLSDADGIEAQHFHATISGQAFLYSPQGKLIFTGGITPSRGHEGDNAGLDAILGYVNHQTMQRSSTFAFGCPIFQLPTAGGNA